MDLIFLNGLSLTYADSIKFENNGSSSKILLSNQEQNLLITLDGVMYFTISEYNFDEDYLDFIDIQHAYRPVNSNDLQQFGSFPLEVCSNESMHIISVHGNVAFKVICKTVEIQSSKLHEQDSE